MKGAEITRLHTL